MTDKDDDEDRYLPDVPTIGESRAARDEAMGRVEDHADDGWYEAATRVVTMLAEHGAPFTADDVWASGLPKPVEPRALGPVFMRAKKDGVIRKVGYTQSVYRHAATMPLWQG